MEANENIICFDTDDELVNYCLFQNPTVFDREIDGVVYKGYDYDWTPAYHDALANNIMFTVKDPNSLVMKRGAVCRGAISKKISNLAK